MLTWKNPNVGKNHGSSQTAENHYERNTTTGKTQRQRLLAPLLRHTAVTVEATTSFSLSLSLSLYTVTLYTHTTTKNCSTTLRALCLKSYLWFSRTSGTCPTSFSSILHPVGVDNHTSPMPTIRHVPTFPILTQPCSPTE